MNNEFRQGKLKIDKIGLNKCNILLHINVNQQIIMEKNP